MPGFRQSDFNKCTINLFLLKPSMYRQCSPPFLPHLPSLGLSFPPYLQPAALTFSRYAHEVRQRLFASVPSLSTMFARKGGWGHLPILEPKESFISVGAPKTQYKCLPCAALLLYKALMAFKGIDCRAVPKLAASCRICRRELKTGWRWRRHPGNQELQWSGMLKHRTGKKLCAKEMVFKQHWLLIKLLLLFVFSFLQTCFSLV